MAQALSLRAAQTVPLSSLSVYAQRVEPGHSIWHKIHSNLNLFLSLEVGQTWMLGIEKDQNH